MICPGIIQQPHYIIPDTKLDMDLRRTAPICRLTARTVTVDGGSTFDAAGRDFDGGDDKVNIAHAADLILGTGDFQSHIWMKATNPQVQNYGGLFNKGAYGAGGFYFLLVSTGDGAGKIQFYSGAGLSVLSSAATYEDGALHLVSLVRADGVLNLYVDKVEAASDATATGDLSDNSSPIIVGNYNASASYYFTGKIVRVQLATATKTFAQAEADMAVIYSRGAFSH